MSKRPPVGTRIRIIDGTTGRDGDPSLTGREATVIPKPSWVPDRNLAVRIDGHHALGSQWAVEEGNYEVLDAPEQRWAVELTEVQLAWVKGLMDAERIRLHPAPPYPPYDDAYHRVVQAVQTASTERFVPPGG